MGKINPWQFKWAKEVRNRKIIETELKELRKAYDIAMLEINRLRKVISDNR